MELYGSLFNISGSVTASAFTGSYIGDGAGLYNLPASGVTGLNLSQISSGGSVAAITSTGFTVNTNTQVQGNLSVTGALIANQYIVSSSVVYMTTSFASGSSAFGNDNNDVHQFTGSVQITGSISLNGQAIGTGKLDETVFQSYTSSNNSRISSLETSSGSLNSFTSSINTTIKSKLDADNVISGSIQVALTGTTGYSTFSSSISSSIADVSSSVAITTSGLTSTITSLSSSVSSSIGSISSSVATTTSGLSSSIGSLSSSIATTDLNQSNRLDTIEGKTGSYATTGSNLFKGTQTHSGSILPSVDNTYDLGSATYQWRDVYISSGSLYIDGTKVISSTAQELQITTDNGQSIKILESGTDSIILQTADGDIELKSNADGDILLDPTNGKIMLKGPVEILSGQKIQSSVGGTPVVFANDIVVSGSIDITGTIEGINLTDFSSSANTRIGNLESGAGSLNSYTSSNTTNINAIHTATGSLNTFTSSINTTIKSKLDNDGVISGSVQVVLTGTTGYSTFSSSVSTSIGSLSGSIAITTSDLSSSVGSLSSSVATTTSGLTSTITSLSSSVSSSIGSLSSSVATTTSGLSSSIGSLSSSVATTTSDLSSSIGSLSSSVATTTSNIQGRATSLEGKTGSYATTGSNIFQGDQTITGSLYISQNLIIAGSSSIQHISSSIVNIADNIITVNAQNPALRFGGLAVIDSGSSPQVSGSLLFDAIENEWLFVHQNQASVTSALLIMGPETYNDIGNEIHLTNNRLVKSTIDEHVGDSNITDTGTNVSINSNTEVTGTLKVTGVIGSPTITAIETSTSSLNTFTSSLLTAIELTGSNLTVKGNFLVKGTTTNVNTATLDVDNNLINLNGTNATFAGLRVKDSTAPNQISGSLLWDATNDYWIAGQLGSEQRIVRETEFNTAVTRIGNIETSTGSLNSFTSSINTTIKNKLNSDGVVSGSVQVNHNGTTNYDANQHVDHTAISISAGSGLSGGGTIAATRTITLDTGSVHFLDGVKKELNTEGVISGSSQVLSGTGIWSGSSQLPSGVVSGSSQVLSGTGIWSGSAQLPSGVVSGSSQVLAGTTIHSGAFFNGISVVSGSAQISFNGITDKPTLVSGSSQITFLSISSIPSGLVSGSSQVLSGTGIWSGSAQLPSGVISGSAQVVSSLPAGTISGSAQLTSTFVQKSGDTMTGQLIVGSTVTAGEATLKVNTSSAISFIHSQENFAANMTAGQTNLLVIGQAGNTKNAGYLGYNWSSSASNSNYVSLGHWGADNLFRVYGDGTLYMGTVTTGVWNGTSIGTAYTAAKVTAVNAGTGISVDTTTGSVTVTNTITNLNQLTNGPGYITGINSSAVTTALGYTPYNATNPSGYITGISFANVSSKPTTISGYGITDAITTGNIGSQSVSYASTAGSADQIDGIGIRNTNTGAVAANTLDSNGFTYVTDVDGSSSNLTGNSTDGALYSQIYSSNWQHQIYGDYRTGIMYVRGKNSGTWQSWKRVALSSATTFSSVTSLTFTHNLGTANLTAQVFDTNGDMFFPSNIRVSSTQVIVTFASARSGRLVVTG